MTVPRTLRICLRRRLLSKFHFLEANLRLCVGSRVSVSLSLSVVCCKVVSERAHPTSRGRQHLIYPIIKDGAETRN